MSSSLDTRIEKLSSLLFDDINLQEKFSTSLKNKNSARSVKLNLEGESNRPLSDVPDLWTNFWSLSESEISSDNEYSLDISSVFMISPLIEIIKTINQNDISVCDTCASPGGKSILSYKLLNPSILLSNEKSPQRIKALISNFSKLKIKKSAISMLDLKSLQNFFTKCFDVVLLDAPCSGQSLISRGVNNPSSLTRIAMDRSSNTQKGLISNAAKIVRPQGYLLYSTCTYSRDENEKVIEWFLRKNPSFKTVKISHLKNFQSTLTEEDSYRLWPYQNLGSGGFCCLLKNCEEANKIEILDLDQISRNIVWKSL
jgi:hypothetical protein